MTTTDLKTILFSTLALLMLSVPTELRAQQLQASLSHYSTEDGMPSNTVPHGMAFPVSMVIISITTKRVLPVVYEAFTTVLTTW